MTTPRPAGPASSPGRGARGQGEVKALAGWGTPALALGVISVGTAWVLGWVGVGAGLLAVVIGFIGARKAFHDPLRSGGAALGGLALGLVGLVWGLFVVVPGLLGIGTFGEGLNLDECMSQANGQQEQRMCATQHLEEYRARYPGSETS